MKRSVAVNVGLAPAQWGGQAEGLDPVRVALEFLERGEVQVRLRARPAHDMARAARRRDDLLVEGALPRGLPRKRDELIRERLARQPVAAVARPLVEGLRNPTVAHDERIRTLLPRDLTPFDDAAREALADS